MIRDKKKRPEEKRGLSKVEQAAIREQAELIKQQQNKRKKKFLFWKK